MPVEYCHTGDHYVDLDHDNDGAYLNGTGYCCWNHMTDEQHAEQEAQESQEAQERKLIVRKHRPLRDDGACPDCLSVDVGRFADFGLLSGFNCCRDCDWQEYVTPKKVTFEGEIS
jgi:hypothetical protein